MPTWTGGNGAFTPSTTIDNYVVDFAPTAGTTGKVVAFGWGGRLTTSTGYRTRWVRPTTAGSSSFTALTQAFGSPNFVTVGGRIGFYTTAGNSSASPLLPADPGGNLWAQDWNAQGGVGMVVLPLANPWQVISGVLQGQISCRNIAGTDASGSSYEATVEE